MHLAVSFLDVVFDCDLIAFRISVFAFSIFVRCAFWLHFEVCLLVAVLRLRFALASRIAAIARTSLRFS